MTPARYHLMTSVGLGLTPNQITMKRLLTKTEGAFLLGSYWGRTMHEKLIQPVRRYTTFSHIFLTLFLPI